MGRLTINGTKLHQVLPTSKTENHRRKQQEIATPQRHFQKSTLRLSVAFVILLCVQSFSSTNATVPKIIENHCTSFGDSCMIGIGVRSKIHNFQFLSLLPRKAHFYKLKALRTSIQTRDSCCFFINTMPVQTRSANSAAVAAARAPVVASLVKSEQLQQQESLSLTNGVRVKIILNGRSKSDDQDNEDIKKEVEGNNNENKVTDFSSFVFEPNTPFSEAADNDNPLLKNEKNSRIVTPRSSARLQQKRNLSTPNSSSSSIFRDNNDSVIIRRASKSSTRPRAVRPKKRLLSTTSSDTDDEKSNSFSSTTEKAKDISKKEIVTPQPSTPTKKKPTTPSSKTSSSRKKRQRIEPNSLPPPSKTWLSTYNLVKELRSDRTAPVDTDGSHALPQKELGEKVFRYQVLIALMLSSQTKDAVVGETMRNLQKHGLTPEKIQNTPHEKLNQLLQKVGFHNNKTKYIKEATSILLNKYDGDIPPTATKMMELPGVGPKMAYIIEAVAFKTVSGIGVDTHMHRIFNDLKWVKSKTPEQTREQLEGWLPREYWGEVNVLWVGFGQEVQQQKEKALKKAIFNCSKPVEALGLYKKLGIDVKKEAKRFGLEEEVARVMNGVSAGKK